MKSLKSRLTLALALVLSAAPAAGAQAAVFNACYVPAIGAIYMTNRTGLPTACLATGHVALTWTDGGVADGGVTTVKLADGSVTTIKLADLAIATAKLADVSVTSAKIADGAVVVAKLADGSVTAVKLADGSVTAAKFADGSVATAKLADGSVTIPKLSFDPATQTELDAYMTLLSTVGTVNTPANPIDFSQLKNVPAASAGDITSVVAGNGLTGGATAGDASLAVSYAGPGSATTVARSDHNHSLGNSSTGIGALALAANTGSGNTAVGEAALQTNTTGTDNSAVGYNSLQANTSGAANTAVGRRALELNTTGVINTGIGYRALGANTTAAFGTAVGGRALQSTTTGQENTAVGFATLEANVSTRNNTALGAFALNDHTTGDYNVALGSAAMLFGTTGEYNVAIGSTAMQSSNGNGNVSIGVGSLATTTGDFNIAVGAEAGHELVTGSRNIYIGHSGFATEDDKIRIGNPANGNFRTYIAGIRGFTTINANAVAVLIDSDGQLGTVSSSARFKEDISDMGDVSRKLLDLRPVQFRYKQPTKDGSKPLQYGLIAEEVAEHLPQLVDFDSTGAPTTVYYHILPSLLLNEIQRQERELGALRKSVAALEAAVAALQSARRERP